MMKLPQLHYRMREGTLLGVFQIEQLSIRVPFMLPLQQRVSTITKGDGGCCRGLQGKKCRRGILREGNFPQVHTKRCTQAHKVHKSCAATLLLCDVQE